MNIFFGNFFILPNRMNEFCLDQVRIFIQKAFSIFSVFFRFFFCFHFCAISLKRFLFLLIYIEILFIITTFIVIFIFRDLFLLNEVGFRGFFSIQMLCISIFFRFNPIILFQSGDCRFGVFYLFIWWFLWLRFNYPCLNSFEDIVELFIDRLVLGVHCSMFFQKVFADF